MQVKGFDIEFINKKSGSVRKIKNIPVLYPYGDEDYECARIIFDQIIEKYTRDGYIYIPEDENTFFIYPISDICIAVKLHH